MASNPKLLFSNRLTLILLAIGFSLPIALFSANPKPAPLEEALDRLDRRDEWKKWGETDFPRHPAEKFLEGWVIVLDPGHGGDGHRRGYKMGPTGVREAEMNWRVSLFLERLLTEAGALVTLTRIGDHDVSLADRAKIANSVERPDGGIGADLFISIHHNATSSRKTNYTSIWHHGEIDWSEPDIDVARYMAHSLFRHLRTDAGLTSYLLSDQLMYSTGFGVLRQTNVPAVLAEISFYTNPEEEKRLDDPIYNLREAYAIYEALCEYAYGGRPTQSIPEISIEENSVVLRSKIDDGLPSKWWGSGRNRTVQSSIQLFFDEKPVTAEYDPEKTSIKAILPISLKDLKRSEASFPLRIHHANQSKHHNWPQRYQIHLSKTANNRLESRIDVLGARRAGQKPVVLTQGNKTESTDETDAEEKTPEEPEILAQKTIETIGEKSPGEIFDLNAKSARNLPLLPIRISADKSPQFLFSNAPERLHSEDGIALQEKVRPGKVRLYVYHTAEAENPPKNITAVIENLGEKPLNLRFHRYSFQKPGRNYHLIGKNGLIDFFKGENLPENRTVAPGEIIPIDPNMDTIASNSGDLVHGFYEFEIDQPAEIKTLQRSPGVSSAEAAKSLEPFPQILPKQNRSGAGRGIFPVSNFLVTLASEIPFDTAEGPARILLADGRKDPWMTGTDTLSGETSENRGNYGSIYRIRFKRTSSDGRSLAILMNNPFGENSPCSYLASALEIRSSKRDPEIIPIPNNETGFKGGGKAALVQILPPLPKGESEIVEIRFSPPGASCLPNPLILLPF